MINVNVERDLNAPPSEVWQLLEDFGNVGWIAGPDKVEIEGEGVGMLRRLHMEGMDPIEEVLEAVDSDAMTLSYSIPQLPMPITEYYSTVKVTANDDGTTHISWGCRAQPQGIDDAEAQAMLEGVYDNLINQLDAALNS